MAAKPRLTIVHGQPGWALRSNAVRAHLTRVGGHLGPVEFRLGPRRWIQPYSIAPWAEERLSAGVPPILRVLRGDFFCCPFGGNAAPYRGERHPVHGETANGAWKLAGVERTSGRTTLHATLRTTVRKGRIDKFITLADGEPVAYVRHVISGLRGPMCLGHHAMLKFPSVPGAGAVSVSPFVRGQVLPEVFENPAAGGYQSLKPGARFRSLERVPLLAGGFADLGRYPARRGFEDLVMLSADPGAPFAWTAVAFPQEGYAWFALKNPRLLRHTVLWHSNAGRHYPPWNGRHEAVLGLEEVTAYFHLGLAESARPNPVSRAGLPTTLALDPREPTSIPYIMGVAAIPRGFDRVETIEPADSGVRLQARSGRSARCAVDLEFLSRP